MCCVLCAVCCVRMWLLVHVFFQFAAATRFVSIYIFCVVITETLPVTGSDIIINYAAPT
jgi:hypothetical protein